MEPTNALALDYVDPALEGQNITFACPTGQTLNGSNSSTCMGNGEWKPDPGEVECTGVGTTAVTTSGMSALNVIVFHKANIYSSVSAPAPCSASPLQADLARI